MNLLTGPDLQHAHDKDTKFTLSARQTFEYIYSLLCSVIFFQGIPSDRHLDNLMFDRTGKKVVITIGGRNLYFKTTTSLVHIDYQVLSDKTDLQWGDATLSQHLDPKYADSIKEILSANSGPVRKVEALAELFKDFDTDLDKVDENATFLKFSSTLGD